MQSAIFWIGTRRFPRPLANTCRGEAYLPDIVPIPESGACDGLPLWPGEDSVDLDIGELREEISDSAPTDTARILPSDLGLPDDSEVETMSEIGTKLDLARAYMDMGDPHGARSILQEVIEEGSDTQKQEAQQLLDNLP